ncbi:hypothetical protein BD413DRAFT_674802 [Trametes elegans]|nr:hypothetical protein BD413DRAFT_674802 [Trametes elegans]
MVAVTGVHRALYNADILSQVLSHFTHPPIASCPPHIPVQAENKPGIAERTLAYAARMCKAFFDVALRKLWSSLPDLWLVLSAFQVVGEDPNLQADARNFQHTLVGEISRDNWARFRDYARLISEVR